jgi:hypothetical protein
MAERPRASSFDDPDTLIDNEANDDDADFDEFERSVFGEEAIDAPELAPLFEEESQETVDHALEAAASAEREGLVEANIRERETESVSGSILDSSGILMKLHESTQRITPLRAATDPVVIAERAEKRRRDGLPSIPQRCKWIKAAIRNLNRRKPILDNVSEWTRGTIARKFLVPGIRLEELSADTQAKIIHGDTNFTTARSKTQCCALCGFRFQYRGSMRSGVAKEVAVSYDHFIPINFAATIFRVVSSGGKYSDFEFSVFRSIGDMVCWHCNYTKGQAMFITCPVGGGGSFDNLRPNVTAIRKFFRDLYNSRSKWAYNSPNATGADTSLARCVGPDPTGWLDSRTEAITARANQVISLIKEHVDFNKARTRLGEARETVRRTLSELETNPKWKDLQQLAKKPATAAKAIKDMSALRRKVVAKAFAVEELNYVRPWKKIQIGTIKNSNKAFTEVVCQPSYTAVKASPKTQKNKGFGPRKGGTYRRRLAKLV